MGAKTSVLSFLYFCVTVPVELMLSKENIYYTAVVSC